VATVFTAEVDSILALFALCETWVPDSKALRPSSPGDDAVRHWRMRHPEWSASDDPRRHLAFWALALLSSPCGEAPADLFLTLEWLLDSRRLPLSIDVLSNEGVVRMWRIYTDTVAGLPFVRPANLGWGRTAARRAHKRASPSSERPGC
jgi:hypothetical protein